jgi:hypothetical protein
MHPSRLQALRVLLCAPLFAACGGEANDSSRWVGHTYLLTIPAANWSEPRGIGGDIGSFVPQFLFGVARAAVTSDLEITIGTATANMQNLCNPVTKVTITGTNYPKSLIVAPAFPLHIIDTNQTPTVVVDTTVHDFSFKNILPQGGVKEGEVSATIDAAEIYPLFRLIPNPTKESVCMALSSAGAACAPCPHNGEPYCLTVKAVQLSGTPAPTAVMPIAANDRPDSCANL